MGIGSSSFGLGGCGCCTNGCDGLDREGEDDKIYGHETEYSDDFSAADRDPGWNQTFDTGNVWINENGRFKPIFRRPHRSVNNCIGWRYMSVFVGGITHVESSVTIHAPGIILGYATIQSQLFLGGGPFGGGGSSWGGPSIVVFHKFLGPAYQWRIADYDGSQNGLIPTLINDGDRLRITMDFVRTELGGNDNFNLIVSVWDCEFFVNDVVIKTGVQARLQNYYPGNNTFPSCYSSHGLEVKYTTALAPQYEPEDFQFSDYEMFMT